MGTGNAFLVVDDHPLFCDALRETVSHGFPDWQGIAVHSIADAVDRLVANGLTCHFALVDLMMPDAAGLDGAERMIQAAPDVPVIIISAIADPLIIARARHAGARGFIPKTAERDHILAAVRTVIGGGCWFDGPAARDGVGDQATPGGEDVAGASFLDRLGRLTPQQLRVLELICQGKANKIIAFDLDISESTVKAHITAVLRKLQVHSRTQAVLEVQRHRGDLALSG